MHEIKETYRGGQEPRYNVSIVALTILLTSKTLNS